MSNSDPTIFVNPSSSSTDNGRYFRSSTICGIEVTTTNDLKIYFKSAKESDTSDAAFVRRANDDSTAKDPRSIIETIVRDLNNNKRHEIVLGDDFSEKYIHPDVLSVTSVTAPSSTTTIIGTTSVSGDFSAASDVTLGDANSDTVRINGYQINGKITETDKDVQSFTLTAAEFKTGIVVHTSVTGAGVVTFDTGANFVSGLGMSQDDVATCLYINDGNQNVTLNGGTPAGVTYVNNPTIAAGSAATLVVRRTGTNAVSVYIV